MAKAPEQKDSPSARDGQGGAIRRRPRPRHETGLRDGRCSSEMSHLRQHEFGFEQVSEYRLYGLDGVRKVASGEWIEADDDEAAIEVATEKFGGRICEVWQGLRMVARLDLRDHG